MLYIAGRILLIIFIVYLCLIAGLYFFQRRFLYYPDQEVPNPADWQVPDVEQVKIKTKDGLELLSWYKKAKGDKPTIVLFHGNGGHLGFRGPRMRFFLDEGYGVFMLTYRGYSGNEGSPTEQGLYNDARAAVGFLQEKGIPFSSMVFYGESLGTAVAVQMAYEYKDVGGVILQAPFTSMYETGQGHHPYAPVSWILADRFDSLSKIKGVLAPIIIFHGVLDDIVPVYMAKVLYKNAVGKKFLKIYDDKGHNDIFSPDAVKKMIEFIVKYVKHRK